MHHLAQMNVARLRHPLDAAETAEFVTALAPINLLAETSPGFIWRLQDEGGASSSYVAPPQIDDPLLIVNYSIWTDLESLRHFVSKSGHVQYLRRRREWFEVPAEESTVCWWIEPGTVPSVEEAYDRLLGLRAHGSSSAGWSFRHPVEPPAD